MKSRIPHSKPKRKKAHTIWLTFTKDTDGNPATQTAALFQKGGHSATLIVNSHSICFCLFYTLNYTAKQEAEKAVVIQVNILLGTIHEVNSFSSEKLQKLYRAQTIKIQPYNGKY